MNTKSANAIKLDALLGKLLVNAIDTGESRNVAQALYNFANENFVYIVDLADAYDEMDAEK